MVPLGEQKQEEVAQTYETSCRYVTYSRFGKLCLIVKEYIVILFLKVIKKGFFNVVLFLRSSKKDFLMSCSSCLFEIWQD